MRTKRLVARWTGFMFVGLALCMVPLNAGGQTAASAPPAAEIGARDLSVSERGTVELHVQGADLRRVLQLLSTQSKTNIIAAKDVQGQVTADLYGVTFTEALEAVLRSTGFGYLRKGNFIYVYTLKQLEELEASQRQTAVQVFHLNYITANDAKALITPALSKDGNVSTTPAAAMGVGSAKDQAGGNSLAGGDVLIVRDYPENLEKVSEIVRRLDVRPQQVLIEAVIMRATLDEENQLGVNFNVLAGIDFSTFGSSTDLSGGMTGGSIPPSGTNNAASGISTGFQLPSGGLSVGFVSSNVALFVKALEGITDVVVMANPKLLVMNKQRGEVMVGNRDGYKTTTVSQNVVTETVEFLETGTQLIVRPYIGDDGYVRLELHPEDSTGGLTADKLPSEQTTEATSNVLVKDGRTIVIGGMFRERTTANRSQVPYLGNIPIAGTLFRNRDDRTQREEVIILITPHIIKQSPDEIASEQMKEDVDRIWLGQRQGMMWFGRDRLAQTHMVWARQQAAAGNMDKALWDTKMALSLEPRMLEAIRLKEQLTRQAIWATESRSSDTHYVLQEMIMNELGLPADIVIPPLKPFNVDCLPEAPRKVMGIQKRLSLPFPPPQWCDLRFDFCNAACQAMNECPPSVDVDPAPAAATAPAESLAPTTQPVVNAVIAPTSQPSAEAVIAPSTQPSDAGQAVPVTRADSRTWNGPLADKFFLNALSTWEKYTAQATSSREGALQ